MIIIEMLGGIVDGTRFRVPEAPPSWDVAIPPEPLKISDSDLPATATIPKVTYYLAGYRRDGVVVYTPTGRIL